MKTLVEHLAQYAAYHRDPRNIATHMIGIPMIVLAVEVLLSRPVVAFGGLAVTPAMVASALATAFYLRLDRRFGMVMGVLLALGAWAGLTIEGRGTTTWLASGVGVFVVGWAFQFVGHFYEGRKPAFVDDLSGLIIGPLFIVAELAFLIGLRRPLRHAIETGGMRGAG